MRLPHPLSGVPRRHHRLLPLMLFRSARLRWAAVAAVIHSSSRNSSRRGRSPRCWPHQPLSAATPTSSTRPRASATRCSSPPSPRWTLSTWRRCGAMVWRPVAAGEEGDYLHPHLWSPSPTGPGPWSRPWGNPSDVTSLRCPAQLSVLCSSTPPVSLKSFTQSESESGISWGGGRRSQCLARGAWP